VAEWLYRLLAERESSSPRALSHELERIEHGFNSSCACSEFRLIEDRVEMDVRGDRGQIEAVDADGGRQGAAVRRIPGMSGMAKTG